MFSIFYGRKCVWHLYGGDSSSDIGRGDGDSGGSHGSYPLSPGSQDIFWRMRMRKQKQKKRFDQNSNDKITSNNTDYVDNDFISLSVLIISFDCAVFFFAAADRSIIFFWLRYKYNILHNWYWIQMLSPTETTTKNPRPNQ